VKKVKGTKVKVYDTRKTTPLLRDLEKYAVRTGGGVNHRMGLWDQVLIKENHIAVAGKTKKTLDKIIKDVKRKLRKKIPIEIEVQNLREFKEVLKGIPDIALLDNMSVAQVKRAVVLRKKISPSTLLEVSGGINLGNVAKYARCGVERISVGSITHSAPSVDVSMEVV